MGALTKPRPIGVDHPKREISNFAGMSSTEELTKGILRGPLKIHRAHAFIKLHSYLTNGSEGGPHPLLYRALLGWLIPNATFRISME